MNKLLIIKLDHIGDVLWAFPAVAALKASWPHAVFDLVCTPYAREAGERMPGISRVHDFDPAWPLPRRLAALAALRREGYDTALVLGPADKYNYVAWASGARTRIGYHYAGKIIPYLLDQVFMTRRLLHPADAAQREGRRLPHEVEAMGQLAAQLGAVLPARFRLSFPVYPEEAAAAQKLLAPLGPGPFGAFQLVAKAVRRGGWDAGSFATLAVSLRNALPHLTWLATAGPLEAELAASCRPGLAAIGVPMIEDLPLGQMAALLARLAVFVSWDTGVVHLASAVGTPVVDIFPPQDADYCMARWGPWHDRAVAVIQNGPAPDAAFFAAVAEAAARLGAGAAASGGKASAANGREAYDSCLDGC